MSMMIASLLTGVLLGTSQDETKLYKDSDTDLQFTLPKEWKVEKKRYEDNVIFNVGTEEVLVRFLKTNRRYPAEQWQTAVKMIAETNGGEVLRQWDEDILGIPVHMTQIRFAEGAERKVEWVGLFFTRTQIKLSFRVMAPEPVAAEAEAEWRKVLGSIRTISGELPKADDPTIPDIATPEEEPEKPAPGKTIRLEPDKPDANKAVYGPVKVMANTERGVYAYLPEGWNLAEGKLRGPGVVADINFSIGVGTEAQIKSSYLKRAGVMLSEFDRVKSRLEPKPTFNKAVFKVRHMKRTVLKDEAETCQVLAYGWSGGLGWLMDWQGTTEEYEASKAGFEQLTKVLAVRTQ